MAESLRQQMSERVKGQHQVVVLAAAVAGASLSFGAANLSKHPEVLALLCLLFVALRSPPCVTTTRLRSSPSTCSTRARLGMSRVTELAGLARLT